MKNDSANGVRHVCGSKLFLLQVQELAREFLLGGSALNIAGT